MYTLNFRRCDATAHAITHIHTLVLLMTLTSVISFTIATMLKDALMHKTHLHIIAVYKFNQCIHTVHMLSTNMSL